MKDDGAVTNCNPPHNFVIDLLESSSAFQQVYYMQFYHEQFVYFTIKMRCPKRQRKSSLFIKTLEVRKIVHYITKIIVNNL